MSTEALTALAVGAIVVAVLVIALLVAVPFLRRRRLQSQFGPEYDREVEALGSRRAAEEKLSDRQRRHDSLELHDLPAETKDRYADRWRTVQEHFVDAPERATGEADELITRVMADRGYPTQDFEQQAADLSVEHARTLNSYRTAHSLAVLVERRSATTEDMRQAMMHYRTVFAELIDREVGRTGAFAEPDSTNSADRAVREHQADEHARPRDIDADQRVPRPR